MTDARTLHMELPMAAIRAYCARWRIREFAVFGSVLREDFGPASDLDVLVTFADEVRYTLLDLVRMSDELEALLGRPVDLLTRKGVEESPNYLRRREILGSAEVIYAA